jgi:pyruvate formate lyase activating enzyme
MVFTDLPAAIAEGHPCDDPAPRGSVAGWIHAIEAGGAVDGPGFRYVLFLAGCQLRCRYCHNPDSWHMHHGKPTTSDAVLKEIDGLTTFLTHAHGGVTLSGGEPLVQPAFAHAILHGAKQRGLHTALDTSGFLGSHVSDAFLDDVDLVLLDIKAFSEATYHDLTGVALRPTLDFAQRLARLHKKVWLRYVLVTGLTDKFEEIDALAAYAAALGNIERVDVLPFHKLGEFKWAAEGVPYTLSETQPPEPELTERVREVFRRHGLNAV